METRANHLWVGVVTLLLLAGLAAAIVWIVGWGAQDRKEYDIFFPQAVEGLATGSQVTFAGVPVGKVERMNLWEKDPQFVQVRISVQPNVPILQGTTATVLGSFTGVSTIQLDGARAGAPAIVAMGRDGVPEIRPKAGGIGAILAGAPQLLDSLTTLTDRLTNFLSPQNQRSLEGVLANADRTLGEVADSGPQMRETLAQLEATLAQAEGALAQFEGTLGSADNLLNQEGPALAAELRTTLASARQAAGELEKTLSEAQPAMQEFRTSTLPALEATMVDLRRTSSALRNLTEKADEQGIGGLVGSPPLPDYEP
ncbi:MlaD family protein [Paraurantiacibacter namhicola]|uniref:Mce related protein n=1 Tax=Paraurantiacibacter namhicola TaxID=645517 RepID=A0A1C7DAV7_9SPHN|nr:MlaD family protein [Paraurantiacibacter namhicola]ANU08630.1 mce related protein [Paraurantiacibacter namhicola]